jgi:hypothetical protein
MPILLICSAAAFVVAGINHHEFDGRIFSGMGIDFFDRLGALGQIAKSQQDPASIILGELVEKGYMGYNVEEDVNESYRDTMRKASFQRANPFLPMPLVLLIL